MKRHAVVILAALSVAIGTAGAVAQSPPVPTTDVPALRTALYDDATKPEQREQAAQRLLARPDPAARTALSAALSEFNRPAVQLAAAKALADKPTPDPTLITPLFRLMDPTSNEALLDAASRALSAYKVDAAVLSQLITLTSSGSEPVRLAAIRAVGTFIEKSAAAALMPLIEPGQPPRVIGTASAALAYLSGLDPATDAAGLRAWWAANEKKPDADFAADLSRARASRFDQARTLEERQQEEFYRLLNDEYQRTSESGRGEKLAKWMTSPLATVRAIACRIARTAGGNDFTPVVVKEQLRILVGDASPDVRRRAAAALSVINDTDAVGPIVTQLGQETDSGVRLALAEALRPIRDPRLASATPALLALLNDRSIETAQAAATTLAEIGPTLRAANISDANNAATDIMKVLKIRTTALNNVELRNALVQALTPLQSPTVEQDIQRMLAQPGEDGRVRRVLLTALGRYKKSDYAGDILPFLRDKTDTNTLLVAIPALGECDPNFSSVQDSLGKLIGPNEPANVREAAWKVLSGLFPKAPADQLQGWESKVAYDPAKLVLIYIEQRNRAVLDNKPDKVADRNQQIGDAYAKINRWQEAVDAYREAIRIRQAANPNQPLILLSEGLTRALLRVRQFPQWAEFTQLRLRENSEYQESLGLIVTKEVTRLIDEERNYDAATDLIDRAMKVNSPQLKPKFREDLQSMLLQVQNRNNPRPMNTLPNSAERPILTALR